MRSRFTRNSNSIDVQHGVVKVTSILLEALIRENGSKSVTRQRTFEKGDSNVLLRLVDVLSESTIHSQKLSSVFLQILTSEVRWEMFDSLVRTKRQPIPSLP